MVRPSTSSLKASRRAGLAGLLAAASCLAACGPSDFDPSTLIESVRILASRSDQPFAKPGATVRSQVLAVDGRPDASSNEPMRVFWLPFVCVNPPNDAYYACFSQFEANPTAVAQKGGKMGNGTGTSATIVGSISSWDGGVDASVSSGLGSLGGALADGGSLASIPTGVDISAYLVQGPRAVFQLPSDIVTAHPVVTGAAFPYGLAVVFNIACAGHVEVIPLDPSNPNPEQIPVGCFNAQHQQLTANDYVLGYTEVFAYTTLTNANPVIQSFSFRGHRLSIDGGVTPTASVPVCNGKSCADNFAIVDVPDASWERDPQNPGGPDGGPLGEQVWVDYYATMGSLSEEAILIFDPATGRVTPPHQESLQSVTSKQTGTMWAVVHDNRGGAAWITVPLNAR